MASLSAWTREVLFGAPLCINIFLPCAPLAVISNHVGNAGLTFMLSLLGLVPLAERLGWATEQLAEHTGTVVGGLLNATFGNATELIVAVIAINNGLLRVVQLSLLGSVLSNLLLVLGCAFFFGGLKRKVQTYNADGAMANSTLLILGTVTLLLPTMLHATDSAFAASWASELALARLSSVLLLAMYAAFIYFQLVTHASLFEGADERDGSREERTHGLLARHSTRTVCVLVSLLIALVTRAAVGRRRRSAAARARRPKNASCRCGTNAGCLRRTTRGGTTAARRRSPRSAAG
jgi:calcium/proton exchanger